MRLRAGDAAFFSQFAWSLSNSTGCCNACSAQASGVGQARKASRSAGSVMVFAQGSKQSAGIIRIPGPVCRNAQTLPGVNIGNVKSSYIVRRCSKVQEGDVMQSIKRILVVLDPSREDNVALVRSRLLAGYLGAELHLLVCEDQRDYSDKLDELCESLDTAGIKARYTQTWQSNLTDTIIRTLLTEGCGLVIKQHTPDNPLKKALLTPEDWKLLRYCPAPVLLAKGSAL